MNELNVRKDKGTYLVKTKSGAYQVKVYGANTFHAHFTDMSGVTAPQNMEVGGGLIRKDEPMLLQHSLDRYQTRTSPVTAITPM